MAPPKSALNVPDNPEYVSDIRYIRLRQRLVEQLREKGIRDETVLEAIGTVPREFFVDEALRSESYGDHALPIAAGQTISQPYIVARMTELLELKPGCRVLEIGAGSGYQTAVLALLAGKVFSIERIPALARLAQTRMRTLGFHNTTVKNFDGTGGWSQFAPYDGILAAAAGPEVPQPLVDQLAVGGHLVLPVGDDKEQHLIRISRTESGFRQEMHGSVKFVPLIGRHGFSELKG
ncbi:MAG: protein-L-isoaspartate(D-aspartate) O-methyltransferase [Blastocatellia bacterium]|nr:protein-L-isoaspartate(D-aspartate) O-methyltransferase [Blastocatellia bacterium]